MWQTMTRALGSARSLEIWPESERIAGAAGCRLTGDGLGWDSWAQAVQVNPRGEHLGGSKRVVVGEKSRRSQRQWTLVRSRAVSCTLLAVTDRHVSAPGQPHQRTPSLATCAPAHTVASLARAPRDDHAPMSVITPIPAQIACAEHELDFLSMLQ